MKKLGSAKKKQSKRRRRKKQSVYLKKTPISPKKELSFAKTITFAILCGFIALLFLIGFMYFTFGPGKPKSGQFNINYCFEERCNK
jgi:hypothetical protein